MKRIDKQFTEWVDWNWNPKHQHNRQVTKAELVRVLVCGVITLVTGLMLFGVVGCQEEHKVWGQGEIPAGYQEYFGTDNTARLGYVLSKAVDRNSVIIYGFDTKDPNGQPVRKRGLIERITALEDKVNKLEIDNGRPSDSP